MLLLLTLHIFYFFSFLWLGFGVQRILTPGRSAPAPAVLVINGLIIFTSAAQILNLFFPVNWKTAAGILFCGSFALLFTKEPVRLFSRYISIHLKKIPVAAFLLLFFLWLLILLYAAGPTQMDDTESYHIQMVKWIQEFGSVPGIANLHNRYGFNSSWFSSIALFGFSSSSLNLYTSLNSFLSLLFCFYLVSRLFSQSTGKRQRPAFLILLLVSLIIWPLVRGNSASSNYDFITTLVVFILFSEMSDAETRNFYEKIPELFMWPVYLFTIRITNAPLLIIPLACLVYLVKNKAYRKTFLYILSALLLMVPFLARNIILSGYPFYPSTLFDFFHADWKASEASIQELRYFIKYYNRVSTAYLDLQQTESFGNWRWIPYWFTYLFVYDKFLFVTGAAGMLTWAIHLAKKARKNYLSILFITACCAQVLLWFWVAPDPRFIYGILLFGLFILLKTLFEKLPLTITDTRLRLYSLSLSVLLIFFSGRKACLDTSAQNWVSPLSLPQPPVNTVSLGNGILLHVPEKLPRNWNARCYGTNLPCLYRVDPHLEARGDNMKAGFRLKN